MGLLDDLEDLLDPIFDGVRGLFGGGDDDAGDDDLSPQERVDQILTGGNPGPLGPAPGAGPGVPLPGGRAVCRWELTKPAPHTSRPGAQ